MNRPRRLARHQPLVYALYVNAALLSAILVAMLARGTGSPSAAFAAPLSPQPIAGGGSKYLMPAQFSPSNWGCYIMDIDAGTLCAYQYFPSTGKNPELRLVAARRISFDNKLWDFNSNYPNWREVQRLVDTQNTPIRGGQGNDANAHDSSKAAHEKDPGTPPAHDEEDLKDDK